RGFVMDGAEKPQVSGIDKVPVVNGAYIGSLLGANGATILSSSISANLTNGGSSIAGTLAISSSCFKGNLSVAATQVGIQFAGTASNNLGDSIEFASAL